MNNFYKKLFFIPLFLSLGCITSGIGMENNSLLYIGGVFLALSSLGFPAIYKPIVDSRKLQKAHLRWSPWNTIAKTLNLGFNLDKGKSMLPQLLGLHKNHKFKIEPLIERVGNSVFVNYYTKIELTISNPNNVYFYFKDKELLDSSNSFFHSSVDSVGEDMRIQKRFLIKSNPERFATHFLKEQKLLEAFLMIRPFSIEVMDNSVIFILRDIETNVDYMRILMDMLLVVHESVENYQSIKVA